MLAFSRNKGDLLRILMSLLFLATSQNAFSGFEDRRFEDIRIQLAKNIEEILISSGDCRTQCNGGHLIATPTTGGIGVQLWGIGKNANAVQSILAKYSSVFINKPEMEVIFFELYLIEKNDSLSLPFWKPAKPEIDVNPRRNT